MSSSNNRHELAAASSSSEGTENLSIRNRILSIYLDTEYVKQVTSQVPGAAVVANERCGSWYIPPALRTSSAYFKSTDGHKNAWSFNTRRLNLGLLSVLGKHRRCFLVDSARRKAMSDALSKTVPIWAAVMNRLLFPERNDSHRLSTNERHVSGTEHTQIESCLDRFVNTATGLPLDIVHLRQVVKQPIKVHFCSLRDGVQSTQDDMSDDCVHLICLSASMSKAEASISVMDFHYIPGAGDDAEHWARELTSELLWEYMPRLLLCSNDAATEEAVDVIIKDAQKQSQRSATQTSHLPPIYVTPSAPPFYIGGLSALVKVQRGDLDANAAIICKEVKDWPSDTTDEANDTMEAVSFVYVEGSENKKVPVLNLHCPARKLGSRALRTEFRHVGPFLQKFLASNSRPRLLFACDVGVDLAIGIALATTCLHIDEAGCFRPQGKQLRATNENEGKGFVRGRLVQVLQQTGLDDIKDGQNLGIQRTTLTAVNGLVVARPPPKNQSKVGKG